MAKARTRSATKQTSSAPVTAAISAEERQRMIAEAAYFRAQQRGFTGGDPLADWLAAEEEIDRRLARRKQ